MAGREVVRDILLDLPETEPRHDVLATLWARTRIDDLMSQDYAGIQRGSARSEVVEAITQLGIDYRLMTQFTSFIAVEEVTVTDGGRARRIEVPVDLPQGMSYEGVFGEPASASPQMLGGFGQAAKPSTFSSRNAPVSPKSVPPPPQPLPPPTLAEQTGPSDRLASPEHRKQAELLAKLHPSIVRLIARFKDTKATPSIEESRFVRDGKAEIQIWLAVKNPEALAALKRLGLELLLDSPSTKVVVGRVPLDKLPALAEANFIRYIAPMTSN
jgi:Ca-activated chloride channel family protein